MPFQCRPRPAPTPNLFRYEAIFQITSLAVQGNRRRMAIGPRDASGRRVCLLQHIFPPAAAAGSHFHRGTGLGAKAKTGRGLLTLIRARFLSIGMVMGVCFLLMVSMITSAALRQLGNYAMQHLPGLTLLQSLHQLFPLAVITTLFPAMFNYLPAKTIQWRDVRVEGPLQRSFSPSESWRGSNPSPGRRRPPRPGLPVPSPSCWGGCITPLKVSPSAQNFPKCMRAAVVHAVSTLPRADADFSPDSFIPLLTHSLTPIPFHYDLRRHCPVGL